HLAECFQSSNDTISKYFKQIFIAFSSHPIYSTYIRLLNADSLIPSQIIETRKLYPYFA
ncbi:hypothetical protein P692DRAFT_20667953, partial [Suillus brevipes Sb2]